MLEELHVARLGVVADASVGFAPGLNVLTGETGAGKTMITVALGLALGARATAALVAPGASSMSVEARFRLERRDDDGPDDVVRAAASEDGEVVTSRVVSADGRGSCRVNGSLVAVSALAAAAGGLVEIHGQNASQRLLSPVTQTAFLDRFGGDAHLARLGRYRRAHAALLLARRELAALQRDEREREREKDLLAYQIAEIERAGVRPGEAAALTEEEARLAHVERLLELAAAAGQALAEEGAALDGLREASGALAAAAEVDASARPLADRVAALVAEGDDVLAEVRAYHERLEADPERLQEVRARAHALRDLERKYGPTEEDILRFLGDARHKLAALTGTQERRSELERTVAAHGDDRRRLGDEVSRERRRRAPELAAALSAELEDLGMPGAAIEIRLEELEEAGPDGAEEVSFVFRGGPRQPPLPLAKVASGGELSRTMLACRAVMADLDEVPTLVFDEVDAGIGGRAAAEVAKRLARLARHRQVVVVTHLAQIAAHADRHLRVAKEGGRATVEAVQGEERVREIARMLSGSATEESIAHARSLLEEAAHVELVGAAEAHA